MMQFVQYLWNRLRDERGIETGEWIAILALVLAIAWIVYGATSPSTTGLGLALSTVVSQISGSLVGLTP